ncbi:MAG: hypothetical protein HYV77_04410 [Candidatus Wildermuthbacteria bacterium]|nr:hypothetical protein [Candidatus Wildermuthbacteria bacterium]
MKKQTLKIAFFSLAFGAIALFPLASASAATSYLLSPPSIQTSPGKTLILFLSIDPRGIKNYTGKVELKYPPDLLEVQSFQFGNNWIPLTQGEYSLIDNTRGVLIKTAGFPQGTSAPAFFGSVLFSAKKAGSAAIEIGNGSFALDKENKNLFVGTGAKAFVTITAVQLPAPSPVRQSPSPRPAPTPTTSPAFQNTAPSPAASPIAINTANDSPAPKTTPQPSLDSQTLASNSANRPVSLLAKITDSETNGPLDFLFIAAALITLGVIGYGTYRFLFKSKRSL